MTDGWHYGEGVAFAPAVLALAARLSEAMARVGFDITDAFPGLSGEVPVALYRGPHYMEFTVQPDLSIGFLWERDEKVVEEVVGLDAERAIERIVQAAIEV